MEYHLHCDLAEVSPELAIYLENSGFAADHFLGANDWGISYEPNQHFTRKFGGGQGGALKEACTELSRWIAVRPEKFVGYWEAEVVAERTLFPEATPFDPGVVRPFRLSRIATPSGYFKEKEIHVSFSRDHSDLRLGRTLLAMGLYPVWWPDPSSGEVEEIWTIGGSAAAVDKIAAKLQGYLKSAGGAQGLTMEVEVIADWQTNPPSFQLPPLIGGIEI